MYTNFFTNKAQENIESDDNIISNFGFIFEKNGYVTKIVNYDINEIRTILFNESSNEQQYIALEDGSYTEDSCIILFTGETILTSVVARLVYAHKYFGIFNENASAMGTTQPIHNDYDDMFEDIGMKTNIYFSTSSKTIDDLVFDTRIESESKSDVESKNESKNDVANDLTNDLVNEFASISIGKKRGVDDADVDMIESASKRFCTVFEQCEQRESREILANDVN